MPEVCLRKGVGLGLVLSKRFPTREADLQAKTLRELGEMARVLKMPRYSTARKADIIAFMMSAEGKRRIKEHNTSVSLR